MAKYQYGDGYSYVVARIGKGCVLTFCESALFFGRMAKRLDLGFLGNGVINQGWE